MGSIIVEDYEDARYNQDLIDRLRSKPVAMNIEVNEGQGLLFENKSNNPKAPQFKGAIRIEGQQYPIVAWQKTTSTGRPMLSLKVERGR